MNITGVNNYQTNCSSAQKPPQTRRASQAEAEACFKLANTVYDPRTDKMYLGGKELKEDSIDFGDADSIIADKTTYYNGSWHSKGSKIVRKYEGNESVKTLRNNYANGGDLNEIEYNHISIRDSELFDKAKVYHKINTHCSLEMKSILDSAGIKLGEDEEIKISIDENKNFTVSGLDDAHKLKEINDALKNNPLSNSLAAELRSGYWQVAGIENQVSKGTYSDLCAKATSINFLNKYTDGLTLDDLTYENGTIKGLSGDLSDLVNNASYVPDPKTGKPPSAYMKAKVCLSQVLSRIQTSGKDSIPSITAMFLYKNGVFTANEQPIHFNKLM